MDPGNLFFRFFPATVMLLVSLAACVTDADSPDACVYGVSQALDAGRWEEALEKLDSDPCRRGMKPDEREINRAAAFIGRAGYELSGMMRVALSKPEPNDDLPDLRFIRLLGGLGLSPGALRDLDLALSAHQRAMLLVLPNVESNCVVERLEQTRQRLCEPAEGTAVSCGTRGDGATEVRQSALVAYLEQ